MVMLPPCADMGGPIALLRHRRAAEPCSEYSAKPHVNAPLPKICETWGQLPKIRETQ